jgi:hypothetical protein
VLAITPASVASTSKPDQQLAELGKPDPVELYVIRRAENKKNGVRKPSQEAHRFVEDFTKKKYAPDSLRTMAYRKENRGGKRKAG